MDYYNLGDFSCPVSTTVPDAQLWFDRGICWTYGFNHEEAVRCFRRALEHDPDCAMACWGIAYASGPNYNMPWEHMDEAGRIDVLATCFDATGAALARVGAATPAERALIEALPAHFPQRDPIEDMTLWDAAFADAMRAAQRAHPESLEIRTVCVEALMQLSPWQMWDQTTGAPAPGAATLECRELIETALAENPEAWAHPGLLHFYVHLMEMSQEPEQAIKAGDVLRDIMPDAGHLVHMPTHIDVQCGAYHDVVYWNQKGCAADLKFYEREGALNIYTGYRQHNYHFVLYGAMFLGQFEPAMRAAEGLRDTTPEALLRIESPPMADYFESYLSFGPHILVRFGRWQEATELALPEDPELYCTLAAHVLYARAVGHAALGNVAAAEREEAAFLEACARVPDSRLLHNNTVVDLLEIAKSMVRGEILYRKGAHEAAFAALRHCVALEDALNYDEPWGWMQPSRHALGALLFEQGHLAEAEAVFRADLGLAGGLPRAQVHPENVWALRGLHDCLTARAETVEIVHVRSQLTRALARADTEVAAACFCAQAAMACCNGGT